MHMSLHMCMIAYAVVKRSVDKYKAVFERFENGVCVSAI